MAERVGAGVTVDVVLWDTEAVAAGVIVGVPDAERLFVTESEAV